MTKKADFNATSKAWKFYFLVTSIMLLIVPLAAVIIIKLESFKYTLMTMISDVGLIQCYIMNIGAFGYLARLRYTEQFSESMCEPPVSTKKRFGNISRVSSTNENKIINKVVNYHVNAVLHTLITLIAFGDSVFNLTKFGDQLIVYLTMHEMPMLSGKRAHVVISMIEIGFKCFNELCILFLIIYHKDCKNSMKCSYVRFFIFALAISLLVEWLFTLLDEVNTETHQVQLNSSIESFYSVQRFLYPLAIEFRTCAFIELFNLSIVLSTNSSAIEIVNAENTHNSSSRKLKRSNSILKEVRKQFNKHLMLKHLCSFFLIILSTLIASVSLVVVFFQSINLGQTKTHLITELYFYCKITLLVTILVYTLFLAMLILRRSSNELAVHKKNNFELVIDLFFLFVSNVFLIGFSVISINGTVKSFGSNDYAKVPFKLKVLTLVASIIPIVESVLQTMLVFVCSLRSRFNIMIDRDFINTLALVNFAMWFVDTFNAKRQKINEIQVYAYGMETWELLGAIFIPLTIFYRFHICSLIIKISANGDLLNFRQFSLNS